MSPGEASTALEVCLGAPAQKIEADPQAPRYIITEPGVGYRFVTNRVSRRRNSSPM